MSEKKGRIKGIGGIFFKSNDPDKMKSWYEEHFALKTNEYGALFEFREGSNKEQKGYLQWSPFDEKTEYFDPSTKPFMINYRVEHLVELKKELEAKGVTTLDEIEEYEYGKFLHILDPEGNKIELWEPIDQSFTELYEGKTNL